MCIHLQILWCKSEDFLVHIGQLIKVLFHLFCKNLVHNASFTIFRFCFFKVVEGLKNTWGEIRKQNLHFSNLLPSLFYFFKQLSLLCLIWQKFGDSTLANLFKSELSPKLHNIWLNKMMAASAAKINSWINEQLTQVALTMGLQVFGV